MAKLANGSWYQLVRIGSEPFDGSDKAWESYFYEGKSLVMAERRMAILRRDIASNNGCLTPFSPRECPTARIEIRRVRGTGDGYEVSEILEVLDFWQSKTLTVFKPETRTEEQEPVPPFQVDDVVRFIPLYAKEYTSWGKKYALVLNCINYGSPDNPNWAVDVQILSEQDFSQDLRLTSVRCYMVAAWQVEKCERSWVR